MLPDQADETKRALSDPRLADDVKAKQCDVGQNVFFWQRLTMKAPWGVCIERAVKEVSDPDAAKVCQAANWNLRQNASLT